MGYTIPLRFIRISNKRSDNRQFDVSICATRIVAMMSTEISQARKAISDERKNGTLINGCGLTKAKTAIFLDNGTVVSSPLSVRRLMVMVDRSNDRAGSRHEKRMKVYDVYDNEPEEDDEETDDISSYMEDSDELDIEEDFTDFEE